MPVSTYRRPPKSPVSGRSHEQGATLQKQREEVLCKLSSFFGEDEDSDAGCDQSPTSVFHIDKELVQDVDVDVISNVEQPVDLELFKQHQTKQNRVDLVEHTSEDDSQFKPLQRYYSLPNASVGSSSSINTKSSLKTSASNRSLNRNVSFTNLSIREYNVELGDNPSCSFGVPISLGWDYEEQEALPLDALDDPETTALAVVVVAVAKPMN
jgi:BRCT domain type II-containing protein